MESLGQIINKMTPTTTGHLPQEQKPLRTSEEQRFVEAVSDKKIVECTEEEIKQPVRYAMMKVGLRAASFPSEEEKHVLITHILQNYGTHTPAEIRLAFDMAISGKLDVDPVCYENFSCLYFSSIMNAYRKWAVLAHDHIIREKQPYEEKQLGYKPHWGEQINYMYRRMKGGEFVPYTSFPVEFYDQMVTDGFIDATPYVSADEKRKIVFLAFQEAIKREMENLYVNE